MTPGQEVFVRCVDTTPYGAKVAWIDPTSVLVSTSRARSPGVCRGCEPPGLREREPNVSALEAPLEAVVKTLLRKTTSDLAIAG